MLNKNAVPVYVAYDCVAVALARCCAPFGSRLRSSLLGVDGFFCGFGFLWEECLWMGLAARVVNQGGIALLKSKFENSQPKTLREAKVPIAVSDSHCCLRSTLGLM